jgi:anaerobic magnesium-protoporphyrin IX monomethyl ester cyclase
MRQPYGVIYTSLGCPYNCSYCNIHALYNDRPGIRFRSPEKVVAEIDLLVRKYKIKSLKIIDELFALREDRVIRICDLITQGGYNLNIWCYARVDTITEMMLKKMKQAGINWVCYGFESASELVRRGVAKKTTGDVTGRAIAMTKAAGINILANFMFGLPDDNLETMQATLDMAREYNFEYVNFYTVMAYPGSQLYEDARKQGMALPKHWYGYGQYSEEILPLPTKYLPAGEVLRFRDRAFREYLGNPGYLVMIGEKFGPQTVAHIQNMLDYQIARKLVVSSTGAGKS